MKIIGIIFTSALLLMFSCFSLGVSMPIGSSSPPRKPPPLNSNPLVILIKKNVDNYEIEVPTQFMDQFQQHPSGTLNKIIESCIIGIFILLSTFFFNKKLEESKSKLIALQTHQNKRLEIQHSLLKDATEINSYFSRIIILARWQSSDKITFINEELKKYNDMEKKITDYNIGIKASKIFLQAKDIQFNENIAKLLQQHFKTMPQSIKIAEITEITATTQKIVDEFNQGVNTYKIEI